MYYDWLWLGFTISWTEIMDSHQHEHQSGWLREFQGFVLHSNVVDIAIGVSIGATVTLLIDSLIKGVLNPLLSVLVGGHDVSNLFVTVKGKHAQTLAEAHNAGAIVLDGTTILNAVMHVVIVLALVLWIVKTVMGMRRVHAYTPTKPVPVQATSSRTEMLLEQILSEVAASNASKNIEPIENIEKRENIGEIVKPMKDHKDLV